jgi:hypothetical protein
MDRLKPWFGLAVIVVMIAGIFAAVPFWTHGLTLDQAWLLSKIEFPVVLCLFAYGLWREGRSGRRPDDETEL